MRKNNGKAMLSYIFYMVDALKGLSAIIQYGEAKYTPARERGWLKYPEDEVMDSLLRHCADYTNGIRMDKESKLPVTDHIMFNASVLCDRFRSARDPYSFELIGPGDSSESSIRPLSTDACDPHPSHLPS